MLGRRVRVFALTRIGVPVFFLSFLGYHPHVIFT